MTSIFERVLVTQVTKAKGARAAQFLVVLDGTEIGLLEKYRDTRTDMHPWKAFAGIGRECKFLSAHYGPAGKILARNAVLVAAGVVN